MLEAFLLISLVAVCSAAMVVISKEIVHSALFLALQFVMMAGFYILLGAEFLALIQVLVYIGGVITMILFTIMLTKSEMKGIPVNRGLILQVLILSVFMALTIPALSRGRTVFSADTVPVYSLGEMGRAMLTTYVLPFELISLVLLVAMVAAIFMAKPRRAA
jgi:NADH-quinone oxidoreductase subunit J